MKLSDLEVGKHVVETREGDKFLVTESRCCVFAICLDGHSFIAPLDNTSYSDDLIILNSNRNLDIVKIYEINKYCSFEYLKNNLNLIWERKEPKKMTVSEICKKLGYEVEIVKEK